MMIIFPWSNCILKLLIIFYFSTKFRRKFVGRQDDADTDSHSDSDFNGNEEADAATTLMSKEDKLKKQKVSLELLEKRLENSDSNLKVFFT